MYTKMYPKMELRLSKPNRQRIDVLMRAVADELSGEFDVELVFEWCIDRPETDYRGDNVTGIHVSCPSGTGNDGTAYDRVSVIVPTDKTHEIYQTALTDSYGKIAYNDDVGYYDLLGFASVDELRYELRRMKCDTSRFG
jgi:hypothetical protein